MCVFIFSTALSETFPILRTERDMIENVYWSSGRMPVILARLFSKDFRKMLKYQISWKSVEWTDGRKDRHDGAKNLFMQFCEGALINWNTEITRESQMKTLKIKAQIYYNIWGFNLAHPLILRHGSFLQDHSKFSNH